jgi:hypothetical protein
MNIVYLIYNYNLYYIKYLYVRKVKDIKLFQNKGFMNTRLSTIRNNILHLVDIISVRSLTILGSVLA